MKLAYAFLANSAERTADGRLWLAGADLDAFQASSLPVTGRFVLVAKVEFDVSEIGRHDFSLAMTGTTGEKKPLMSSQKKLHVVGDERKQPVAKILLNLATSFEAFGKYAVHVIVDGVDLAAVPLEVQQHSTEQSSDMTSHSNGDTADDESESWDELDAAAMSPQQLREIADYIRSTGQASA